MRTLLLWLSIAGTILTGMALEGGHVNALLQPTAALIVFGPILAYLLFRLGPTKSWLLFRRILRNEPLPKDEFTLDRIATLGFLTSAIAGVLGMIHVMSHLADPTKLGAGIAVAFVGVLYGTLPALLIATIKRARPRGPTAAVLPLKRKTATYLAASIFVLLFSFMTVLYALSQTSPPILTS